MTDSGTEKKRSLSVICSKGSFDMAYPGLILANAARMAGVDARLFFTFWGLDIVNEKKIDHLHLNLVGNPSAPLPAMIAGLPGVEALATAQMRKEMERLDIPPIREFIEMLDDAGADLYGCQMALDMFKLTKDDSRAAGQGRAHGHGLHGHERRRRSDHLHLVTVAVPLQ